MNFVESNCCTQTLSSIFGLGKDFTNDFSRQGSFVIIVFAIRSVLPSSRSMKWRPRSHDVILHFCLVWCTFSVDQLGDGSLTASVYRALILFTGSN